MHTISGISTQGYKTYNDWVTSYKIVYKADDDVWKEYTLFGNAKVSFLTLLTGLLAALMYLFKSAGTDETIEKHSNILLKRH